MKELGIVLFVMVIMTLLGGIVWITMPQHARGSLKATVFIAAGMGGFLAALALILRN